MVNPIFGFIHDLDSPKDNVVPNIHDEYSKGVSQSPSIDGLSAKFGQNEGNSQASHVSPTFSKEMVSSSIRNALDDSIESGFTKTPSIN